MKDDTILDLRMDDECLTEYAKFSIHNLIDKEEREDI
jgi:hypothetical protein